MIEAHLVRQKAAAPVRRLLRQRLLAHRLRYDLFFKRGSEFARPAGALTVLRDALQSASP